MRFLGAGVVDIVVIRRQTARTRGAPTNFDASHYQRVRHAERFSGLCATVRQWVGGDGGGEFDTRACVRIARPRPQRTRHAGGCRSRRTRTIIAATIAGAHDHKTIRSRNRTVELKRRIAGSGRIAVRYDCFRQPNLQRANHIRAERGTFFLASASRNGR